MPPDPTGLTLPVQPEADEDARRRPPLVPPIAPPADDGEALVERAPRAPKAPKPPKPSKRRERVVARRVRRIVRRLDPWSVLKVSLVFYVCTYVVTMVAGVLLWNVAERADMITKLEDFVEELGAYERFELLPDVILQRALLIGAILAIVATGLTVLAAVLFNLISDLVGGIRVVVLEEETARPARPARSRPVPFDGGVPNPERTD